MVSPSLSPLEAPNGTSNTTPHSQTNMPVTFLALDIYRDDADGSERRRDTGVLSERLVSPEHVLVARTRWRRHLSTFAWPALACAAAALAVGPPDISFSSRWLLGRPRLAELRLLLSVS